jgi:hypothetical protein
VITGLWLLDVVLAWVVRGARGRVRAAVVSIHGLTWIYVLVSFLVASIYFFKNNTIFVLGWLMVGVVALSLLIHLFSRRPGPAPTQAA